MQVAGQLRGCDVELDRVVEAAAVHGPKLTTHALLLQVFIRRRGKAAVQKDEVKRRTNPRNRSDDVHPAQQQVCPVEVIAFHVF